MARHKVTDLRVYYQSADVVLVPFTKSPRGTRLMLPAKGVVIQNVDGRPDTAKVVEFVAGLYPPKAAIGSS